MGPGPGLVALVRIYPCARFMGPTYLTDCKRISQEYCHPRVIFSPDVASARDDGLSGAHVPRHFVSLLILQMPILSCLFCTLNFAKTSAYETLTVVYLGQSIQIRDMHLYARYGPMQIGQ